MGLYQVEPAGGRYLFGSPLFDEVTMKVGSGKTFRIKAVNNSAENIYIQRVILNGKRWAYGYIDFKDIQRGGTLEFVMGPKPARFAKHLPQE